MKTEAKKEMKKPVKIILRIVIIFVIANIILALPVAAFIEVQVLKGKGRSEVTQKAEMKSMLLSEAGIDADAFEETYSIEKFEVPSTKTAGYIIPTFRLKTTEEKKGIVIMVHGMNSSHIGIYPEAQAFLKAGFDVWAMDTRKFGESKADYVTYGYYEGADCIDVLSYVLGNVDSEPGLVGLWGQSMGGAAVENAMDEAIFVTEADFVVLDCPMGAMEELTGAPDIQNRAASIVNKWVVGYSFDDQSPYAQIKNNTKPALMINAENETVIPEVSTIQIKDTLTDAPGTLTEYTGKGSKHACVANDHPEEYESTVKAFLGSLE